MSTLPFVVCVHCSPHQMILSTLFFPLFSINYLLCVSLISNIVFNFFISIKCIRMECQFFIKKKKYFQTKCMFWNFAEDFYWVKCKSDDISAEPKAKIRFYCCNWRWNIHVKEEMSSENSLNCFDVVHLFSVSFFLCCLAFVVACVFRQAVRRLAHLHIPKITFASWHHWYGPNLTVCIVNLFKLILIELVKANVIDFLLNKYLWNQMFVFLFWKTNFIHDFLQ